MIAILRSLKKNKDEQRAYTTGETINSNRPHQVSTT